LKKINSAKKIKKLIYPPTRSKFENEDNSRDFSASSDRDARGSMGKSTQENIRKCVKSTVKIEDSETQ